MLLRTLEEYILTFVLLCNSLFLEVKERRQHNKTEGVGYMAIANFNGWFTKESDTSFVISNTSADKASAVTPESFINPPIKMSIPEKLDDDKEIRRYFSVEEGDPADDPPEFVKNLPAIIRSQSSDWRMTGVQVNTIGISLFYATNNPVISARYNREYSTGMAVVVLFSPVSLKMTIDYPEMASIEYNIYAHVNYCTRIMTAKISKTVGGHKVYDLDMCQDNYGKAGCELWDQYYKGNLYF